MSDTRPPRRLPIAQLRPVLPLLAAVLLLLAAWLAWSGWQLRQDAAASQALEQARDEAVQGTAAALAAELRQLQVQLATAPVQAALARGDLGQAGTALAADWRGVEETAIYPLDLEDPYARLDEGGFGRLAALEAALVVDDTVATIAREGTGPRLLLTAPARADDALAGVAYARLPLVRVTAPVAGVVLQDDSAYLALRQGSHTVFARGDAGLADSAEARGAPVPGSGLRIVAAGPEPGVGPFGLSAMACLVLAAVLVLLAAATAYLWRREPAPAGEAGDEAAPAQAPTLAEAMLQAPPPTQPVAVTPLPTPTEPAMPSTGGPVPIDRGIFRAYDIRGVVGQTLDRGVAELIGHAIGSLMHDQGLQDIVVGRDGRLSGPDMADGLVEGLRRAGRNVIDIGMAPTPVVYFAAYHLRTGSCVSVTGSHNPPDYNGFKIVVGGETLSGDAITDLHARIANDRLHEAPEPGTLHQRNIDEDYVQRIASDVQLDRPLRVVVDAGNGVAGGIAPQVLSAIGADVTPLYCDIDGTFPNHHPDPSDAQNLVDLTSMVARLDADLGIAFDGDGDRLGVVTRDGQNIYPDRLLMLFAADVLERNPGAVIVYDVKCTGRLPGQILRFGGSPLMWKTGHSLIKAKMRETEAELAGEMSGHFFFKERWYGFDDGIYAAARLLEILAARSESPAEVLSALPDGVSTPEIKVEAPGGDPHAFVERFRTKASFEGGRLSTIDGLRVDWNDGWGLVRASNTTPVLVLRFDGDDADALRRIQAVFREQLLAVQPDLQLPF
jgi:phosphomannomutase / phosphoglucomutase